MDDSGVNARIPLGTGEQETSPDLLKNTPSNIARLEDVIEHSKGRRKYLARTRSPSDGSDARWYFCKVPLAENELAASVPRTEIVGKGDFLRFGMRDSLAIEASFLQREEELLSRWWREYAECSEGPRARVSTGKKSDAWLDGSSLEVSQSSELYEVEEERVGVPVKGGLYEVDLVKRHCFPVYWNGENRRVLRGHWFACKGGVDWLPLREDVAEQLEIAYRSQVWHRRTFQPSGLFAARVDLQGSTPGLHALFTGEDDTWEAWLKVDASGISVIRFNGNGTKLRRGYAASHSPKPSQDELRQRKEEEMDDYCSQVPVRHLVFMVHGIGQRLAKSNLVDDVANFRHITASLSEQHLSPHQSNTQRVLFIPCQWRKGLTLSGEAAVEKCTLDGVRGLRVMLGATVHDVLYYMSPVYCQEIIDSVSNQLNWLYLKFLKRNPGYDGKVSIYGHSLGSVLSYDILCHQENLYSPFAMDWMFKSHATDQESSATVNNRHMTCDALADSGDNNSGVAKDRMDFIDMNSQPSEFVFQNEHLSEVNPVASDILQIDKMADHPMPETDKEDVSQRVIDSVPTQEGDGLEETTNTFCHESSDSVEHIPEESKDVCNKDTKIKLLTDEIDSLKAKIVELELQCKSGDISEDKVATMAKQPISQKLVDGLPACVDETPKSYTPYISYTKLEFKVDTFFAVGSPLGVFLALRNIRIGIGKGKHYWSEESISEEMPACHQMFNIFHPFDPVAYRVEPLVCKEYVDKRPVIIPYHKGGKRLHIGFQEFTEDLAARSQAVMDKLGSVRARVLTICTSRDVDNDEEGGDKSEVKHEKSYGAIMMERLTGSSEGRIDHVLQDKTFEHPYLQAIGSHTNYWRDHDTALFILKHLYREIPEDPSSPEEHASCSSKVESCSAGMPDQREEELPLTFSDKVMVRSFSRKAKKFMKKPLKK